MIYYFILCGLVYIGAFCFMAWDGGYMSECILVAGVVSVLFPVIIPFAIIYCIFKLPYNYLRERGIDYRRNKED